MFNVYPHDLMAIQHHENIYCISLAWQKIKFKICFLLNAYDLQTIVKLKNHQAEPL